MKNSPKKPHRRSSHFRHLKNGNVIWIKNCIVHKLAFEQIHGIQEDY